MLHSLLSAILSSEIAKALSYLSIGGSVHALWVKFFGKAKAVVVDLEKKL